MGKKKKKKRIRPLALCVFFREEYIFVAEGHDPSTNKTYYRPIGGGIEFGERAAETIIREVQEEIHADVQNLRYLGTLENIFTYDGKAGHEICMIFDGEFTEAHRHDPDYTVEGNNGGEQLFTASWKPLQFFRDQQEISLYPDGLLELLDEQNS